MAAGKLLAQVRENDGGISSVGAEDRGATMQAIHRNSSTGGRTMAGEEEMTCDQCGLPLDEDGVCAGCGEMAEDCTCQPGD
jgi:hypothetical protein